MTTLLGVDLVGRPVLVAGGGPVAAAKAAALVADGALVHVVTPVTCEAMLDLVDDAAVTWSRREVTPDDVAGTWFVVAATGDSAVDRDLCARATAERVFSVCAGAAEHGTARNPAVTEHAGLRVGVVSTGRPDPGRAVAVRNALVVHLQTAQLDLRTRRAVPGAAGRVLLVGGGPGAEDLITVRGRQALAQADVVVTDRLGPTGLLRTLPLDVEVIDVGKTAGHHLVPQSEINRILVEQARRGRTVVRLKGATPSSTGAGARRCSPVARPVSTSRSSPASAARSARRERPAYRSRTAARSVRSTSSTATSGSTGTPWQRSLRRARRSSSSWECAASPSTCATCGQRALPPTSPWPSSRTRRRSGSGSPPLPWPRWPTWPPARGCAHPPSSSSAVWPTPACWHPPRPRPRGCLHDRIPPAADARPGHGRVRRPRDGGPPLERAWRRR